MSTEEVASQARTIVDLLRLVRTLREEYAALSMVLGLALELMHDDQRKFKATDERYLWLLAQHRALMTGRTNAEERHDIEEATANSEAPKAA